MNPKSLCAKCKHLQYSRCVDCFFCQHRNRINRLDDIIYIEKGFKTCINFEPRKEQNNG